MDKPVKQHQLEVLRRKDVLHAAELEKKRRLEWRSRQHQLEELAMLKKALIVKDKELAQLTERLLCKQDECDKLDSEVKRLKGAESWKAISPSSSTSDLSNSHTITVRERDMAMRNSELSFRIRTLEDGISGLREQKQSLEKKLVSVRGELSPIRDQNSKLKVHCNELNTLVRSREKKMSQLSQEILDVKSSHQQAQEEIGKQRNTIKQQLSQCSEYRTQKEKLKFKNEKLRDAYDKLCLRVKELEEAKQYQPLSPNSNIEDNDSFSVSSTSSQLQEHIDQLEFDRDELDAKYTEMKVEYKDLRNKYKTLKLQEEKDNVLLQVQNMALEKEVVLLRCSRDENLFDQTRQNFVLASLKENIEKCMHRIESLESFIIEQDKFMAYKEANWKEECCTLNNALLALQPVVRPAIDIEASECTSANLQFSNQLPMISQEFQGFSRYETHTPEEGKIAHKAASFFCGKSMDGYTSTEDFHSDVPKSPAKIPKHFEKMTQTASQFEHFNGRVSESTLFSHNTVEDNAQSVTNEADIFCGNSRCTSTDEHSDVPKSPAKTLEHFEKTTQTSAQSEHFSGDFLRSKLFSYNTAQLQRSVTSEAVIFHGKSMEACTSTEDLHSDVPKSPEYLEKMTQTTSQSEHLSEGSKLFSLDTVEDDPQPQHRMIDIPMSPAKADKTKSRSEQLNGRVSGSKLFSYDTKDSAQDDEIILCGRCQLKMDGDSNEITNLQHQLSEAQEHGRCLQLLLDVKHNVTSTEEMGHSQTTLLPNSPAKTLGHSVEVAQAMSQTEHVDSGFTAAGLTQNLLSREDILKDNASQTHSYHVTTSQNMGTNQVDGDFNKILELRHQLCDAQEHSRSLQLLLEELGSKLNHHENQTRLQAEEQEKCIVALREKERRLTNLVRARMVLECDKETVVELAKEINNSLLQVEEAHMMSGSQALLSNLEVLRQSTEAFLKAIFHEEFLLPRFNHSPPRDKPDLPELNRVFLVVMDYDPQSLCITGQPDLELSVQSGAIVTVFGEMDEKGYYTASCNDTVGMLPANFIQEVDVHDTELISRLMNEISTGVLKEDETVPSLNCENMQDSGSDVSAASLETDLDSSVHMKSCSNHSVQHGHHSEEYKIFLGLYDYDPLSSSASANPEFELCFKEGSLIKVFGQKMSDGYYIGELNGRRGLVPADFIADTSKVLNSPSVQVKTKTVIALYGYKPLSDSPNSNNESELQFEAGDQIIVYGNMHSDGYYTGQEKGRFGLVPSNYVKDLD